MCVRGFEGFGFFSLVTSMFGECVKSCYYQQRRKIATEPHFEINGTNLVNLGSPQCVATHFFYKMVVCACVRCACAMGMLFLYFLNKSEVYT